MATTKLTFEELSKSKDQWKEAVIVFTRESIGEQYTEEERSYTVHSDEKYFNPNLNGSSLHGYCLDGKDNGVRLDVYMSRSAEEGKQWEIEYCYIVK